MLKIVAVILLSALSPFDIDRSVFDGVWVGADMRNPEQNHVFLQMNDSHAGRFVYVARGKAIVDFEFSSSEVSEPEGYLELSKSYGNRGIKVVLSGWQSREDHGLGLLTGIVYMYSITEGKPKVFNSLFARLWALSGPIPEGEADSDALKKIYQRYAAPGK